jgi:hypothetical protein
LNTEKTSATADIWEKYYEVIELATNTPKVVCKICQQSYEHPTLLRNHGSTSTMRKHERKHGAPHIKKLSSAGAMEQFVRRDVKQEVLTKDELEQLLLHTMIACNWSFNQFDLPHFQYFIAKIAPQHRCPGRKRMHTLLTKAAVTARADIKERLSSCDARISLALDCWSSSNSYNFMGTYTHLL